MISLIYLVSINAPKKTAILKIKSFFTRKFLYFTSSQRFRTVAHISIAHPNSICAILLFTTKAIIIPSPQTIVIGITINCFTIRFSDIGINRPSVAFQEYYPTVEPYSVKSIEKRQIYCLTTTYNVFLLAVKMAASNKKAFYKFLDIS